LPYPLDVAMQEYYPVVFPVESEKFSPEKSVKDRAYLPQALVIMTWLNQEVNSHTGNLITICLMQGWRSRRYILIDKTSRFLANLLPSELVTRAELLQGKKRYDGTTER
jgi:hypothetical protein